MFQVDAQARAIIEGIARLRAGIAVKEVEAKVLRSFATAQNPDLQRVEEEIRALRIELEKVETSKGSGFDPLMSSGRVPEMGTEYLRKLRQLKYNETLYELLSKQFELAKLDEARDARRHPGDRPGGSSGAEVQAEKGSGCLIGDDNNALSFCIYCFVS